MLLRARTVVPVSAPPIDDGAVLVRGEGIETAGRFSELRQSDEEVIDLGDSILLPGLINAHCHLDYTGMAGKLFPARNFSDWIKAIVALKAEWSYTEFADSWLKGAQMLLRSGTTTVVDIETVPELLPDVTTSTPLRVVSCLELLSVRSRLNARQMVEAAVRKLQSLPAAYAGLSPHAPYSTSCELLDVAASAARAHGWLLTTHVAESADELEMFFNARGPMFDWLKSQRDMSDCGGISPIAHLARQGVLAPNFLAVHVNYLSAGDTELLAQSGASVVHCPRSHAFFRHQAFPFEELDRAGVNICLGTDSLATVRSERGAKLELDMFAEMATFADKSTDVAPGQILRMATVNGAQALGRHGEIGALVQGALADLVAIPYAGEVGETYEAIVHHAGAVTASMIRGAWALAPGSTVA